MDKIAQQFRDTQVEEEELTTRQKALALARFVREKNLTGIESDRDYHNLRNNFIGFALRHKKHESMPLVSVAIYCALALRLGLNAQPSGYPFHVYGVVSPPPESTLDGKPRGAGDGPADVMYLDPFRSDMEVPVDGLHVQLRDLGFSADRHDEFLRPAASRAMIVRLARNILRSSADSLPDTFDPRVSYPSTSTLTSNADGREESDVDASMYTSFWALLLLDVDNANPNHMNPQRRQFLVSMMGRFELVFTEDLSLIEQYLLPAFRPFPEHHDHQAIIDAVRATDGVPKPPHRRSGNSSVKYRVGQVFTHKRYSYTAIITGWDAKCRAEEEWVRDMQVNLLPGGTQQSFYHVLYVHSLWSSSFSVSVDPTPPAVSTKTFDRVQDQSARYVAEENIDIVTPKNLPTEMLRMAGKYFKRFDADKGLFVSNIRDEYPDD